MIDQPQMTTQHVVQLQRLATGIINGQLSKGLKAALEAAKRALETSGDLVSYAALARAVTLVESAVMTPTTEAWQEISRELAELADYEANWAAKLLSSDGETFTAPAAAVVLSQIDRALMTLTAGERVQSGTWAEYVKGIEASTAQAYANALKAGYANGETVRQIAGRFAAISDGLLRREAEALVRTGVQHYAQQATEAMYQANADRIEWMVYFSTLDNRTTSLCAGRDGERWRQDDPKRPSLPAHFNCRSRYVVLTKAMRQLEGTRTATGGEPGQEALDEFQTRQARTDKKVRYRGRNDLTIFDVSKVKATTAYEDFFLKQPAWWQDSVFGPTRAKLVRSGGMKISQFNDMTGRQLTLKELRELDAEAFRRAGL